MRIGATYGHNRRWLLLPVFLLLCLYAKAQDEIVPVQHINRYNGLPARVVYNLCKDRSGFIWLASENGVFRFDGKTFLPYTTANGLSDDETIEIFADSHNDIWCTGYNHGLAVIRNGAVDRQDPVVASWNGEQLLLDIVEDKAGFLYLFGEGKSVYRVSPERTRIETFLSKTDARNLYIHNDTLWALGYMRFIYYDRSGHTFMPYTRYGSVGYLDQMSFMGSRTDGSYWYYHKDGRLENIFTHRMLHFPAWQENPAYVQQVDDRFVLVRFVTQGTFLFDLLTDTYKTIRLPKDCYVVDAVRDNQDNIWLSAYEGGIYRLAPYRQDKVYAPGFEGDIVQARKTPGGWTALTRTGLLLQSRNGPVLPLDLSTATTKNARGTRYADFVDLGDKGIYALNGYSVFRIKDNKVQSLGDGAGGKQMLAYNDSLLAFSSGRSVAYRTQRPVWLTGNEYNRTKKNTRIYDNRVFCMALDNNGRLWLSTNEGLRYYDVHTSRLADSLYLVPKGVRVEDISLWRYGLLVLATSNHGVALFGKGHVLTRIDTENGLLDNNCKEVDSCASGWIVRHPQGLSLLDPYRSRASVIRQWKGVPLSSVNRVQVFGDTVALCTIKGLLLAHVDSLFSQLPETRTVHFFRVSADNVSLAADSVQLAYGVEKLRVDFSLAEYEQPYAVEYQWRLDDNAWNKADATTLDFINPQPGRYELQVRARAPGHDWSAVSRLLFYVKTPYWRTWWFMASAGLLLVGGIWWLLRRRYLKSLAAEREKASVRYQLMDFEQKALNAMMNPHFVFNAMGSIQHLLNQGDNRQANDYLVKFSRLIRKSLETSQLEFCYLDDEIERLTLYLQLEKMRFGGRMEFSLEVTDDLDPEQVKIPTMILQTYVENAVIHGVASVARGVCVDIRFLSVPTGIRAEIMDNGPGFNINDRQKRSVRFGVSATEKRLELLTQITGKPFSVNIVSPVSAEGGTRVELLFSV